MMPKVRRMKEIIKTRTVINEIMTKKKDNRKDQ